MIYLCLFPNNPPSAVASAEQLQRWVELRPGATRPADPALDRLRTVLSSVSYPELPPFESTEIEGAKR